MTPFIVTELVSPLRGVWLNPPPPAQLFARNRLLLHGYCYCGNIAAAAAAALVSNGSQIHQREDAG